MSDPVSTSVATYFSIAKIWSITAGVCGSIIPILALADKTKIRLVNAFFMALTGTSFAVFVGPWVAQKLDFTSIEGAGALSWIMGASGVFLIRAVLNWLDKRGVSAIDKVVDKLLNTAPTASAPSISETANSNQEISSDNSATTK